MRKCLLSLVLILVLALSLCPMAGASADGLSAVVDSSSTYTPTQIANGHFATRPFMGFVYGGVNYTTYDQAYANRNALKNVTISAAIPNGVGGGWNTTETQILAAEANLFEYGGGTAYGISPATDHFVEMNANNSAVLYQDLTTYGGDVIRWTLKHAARTDYGGSPQQMRVEIGAPNVSSGNIVAASGINSNVNSQIQAATLGKYEYSGITAGSGTVAFANNSELQNLSLAQNTSVANWYDVAGIYAVPDGQSVTRFAFIATTSGSQIGGGNLLDDITFSTLIGNLSAAANEDDGSVVISGYWGDTDTSKKLIVKIGDTEYQVDMSGVTGKNFTITVPATSFPAGTTTVEVYHQDYATAKRSVKVEINSYILTFCPNGGDNKVDGEAFVSKSVRVDKGDSSCIANFPNITREGCKLLGWTDVAGGGEVKYTSEELVNLEGVTSAFIYPVWGVEVGLPVYVALTDDSELADAGRKYSFKVESLSTAAPMPDQATIELAAPTAVGTANKVGYGPEDTNNPWRMSFQKGAYQYVVTQTSVSESCEILDYGQWTLEVEILPDNTLDGESEPPLYRINWAKYDGSVADLSESSFDTVKVNGAQVLVTSGSGKTSVVLGGNQISGQNEPEFNTAIIKGNFEIDFSRNFQVVGTLLPPQYKTPDGCCIGFVPYSGTLTTSDLMGGGNLGYIGCTKFKNSIVLDFDSYGNGSTYGDPGASGDGHKHFTLTTTKDNGYPAVVSGQDADLSKNWPTQLCQYVITNDVKANTLTFKITLNDSSVLTYTYNNPTGLFGTNIAYFFMSGALRKGPGPNANWGLGNVGDPAPSLYMNFDSFYYLGEKSGFDASSCIFNNKIAHAAEVNGKSYASLQDAINAAGEGDVITLTNDVTENLNIIAGKNVVIDLNGKTVIAEDSAKPVITNNGTLTLTDSVGDGDLTGGTYAVQQNGTLYVGGKLDLTGDDNTNGNIYLPTGKTVNPASGTYAPEEGMTVGVTTEATPTLNNPVNITGQNSGDYSSYFTSDDSEYAVINDGNTVKLKVSDQVKVVDKEGTVTYYPLLTEAVAKAPEGSTIYLEKDVDLGSEKHPLKIGTDLTLDLGGHTLSGSDVVDATNGATVRVTNGTIYSNEGTSCVGVYGDSGTLYVDNVELTGYNAFFAEKAGTHTYLGEGVTTENLNSLYSSNGSGTLHITDGVYDTTKLDAVASSTAKDKIFITGGCFSYDDVETTLPNYVADGYKVVECTHGNEGYYDVVLDETKDNGVELKHIDSQGNEVVTKFNSLQDAINAATDGDVIQLTKDLTENLTVPEGKEITLDLNGNTITAEDSSEPVITNNGTLTLTDSKGGGDLTGGDSGVEQNGTLYVGGKLDLTGDGNTNGNIYLPTGKTVDPADAPYAPDGMKVGVTTEEQPQGEDPIQITSESTTDISDYFTSDQGYAVEDLVDGDKHITVMYGIRKITLTSSSASKTYDGEPLMLNQVLLTSGEFLAGDTFTYQCTGNMTKVGCATNEFTYEIVQSSSVKYEVTCVYGSLTVLPQDNDNPQASVDDLLKAKDALSEKYPGKDISVWMEINRNVSERDKLTLKAKTTGREYIFYNANLYAKIDGVTYDIGDSNTTVIGVTSKFYFDGRSDIHVYRLHNHTEVTELTTTPNEDGEYVEFDRDSNKIVVHAMKYSTYCFTWTGTPPRTGDNTNLWLYIGLAVVSMLGVTTILVSKKKRKG